MTIIIKEKTKLLQQEVCMYQWVVHRRIILTSSVRPRSFIICKKDLALAVAAALFPLSEIEPASPGCSHWFLCTGSELPGGDRPSSDIHCASHSSVSAKCTLFLNGHCKVHNHVPTLWNKHQNRDEALLKLQSTSVAEEFEMLCGTRHDHYAVDF